LYDSWTAVIPTIINSYLQYLTKTTGKLLAGCITPIFNCHSGCEPRRSSLLCLYFDRSSLTSYVCCTLTYF
ncbi:hypothetical protein M404DRAFT_170348, partial [Pisolithus tinctorius Marx 270]